jgi:PAS domain S-box-containing protein
LGLENHFLFSQLMESEMKKNKNESYKNGLRERAEEFINKNPLAIKEIPPDDVKKLIEHLQVHQIELEMQNEELRRAQLELEEARDKYSDLYDFAPVGYFAISDKGVILEANLTGATMLGVERALMIGKPFSKFINRDDQDIYYHHQRELIETESKQTCELGIVKKDGSQFHAQMECIPVFDENGKLDQIRAAMTDITVRKRAEGEKARLEVQLRQAQKMESIGTIAGGIAHEFNNILGVIIGNNELALMDMPDWNPAKNCLKEVQKASLRAKDVVRNILSFARKTPAERTPIRISTVIKESLKLLRASIPTMIEIRQNISCEREMILADPTEVNQVLMNLCTNAVHATGVEAGALEVGLEPIALDKDSAAKYDGLNPGDFVKLTVRDTGHGIDPEIIGRIFDPYFTTKSLAERTGMGLAIVYGIVKKHDGAIRVESEAGKGTVFEVLFPLHEGVVEQEVKEKPEVLPKGTERILFVDDEPSLVEMAERMLRRLGYDVETKTSSVEALDLFKEEPDRFDLVITDIGMPHMAGDMLAQKLIKIRPDVPVIICTGYSDRMDEDNAKERGIKAFVMKPLVMRDLAKTVREVLD